jgi:hypothetical protein
MLVDTLCIGEPELSSKNAQNDQVWRERRGSWTLTFAWNILEGFLVEKINRGPNFFS